MSKINGDGFGTRQFTHTEAAATEKMRYVAQREHDADGTTIPAGTVGKSYGFLFDNGEQPGRRNVSIIWDVPNAKIPGGKAGREYSKDELSQFASERPRTMKERAADIAEGPKMLADQMKSGLEERLKRANGRPQQERSKSQERDR